MLSQASLSVPCVHPAHALDLLRGGGGCTQSSQGAYMQGPAIGLVTQSLGWSRNLLKTAKSAQSIIPNYLQQENKMNYITLKEIFTYSMLQFKNSSNYYTYCKTVISIRLHKQYFKTPQQTLQNIQRTSEVLLPVQNAFKFLYKVELATSLNSFKNINKKMF